MSLNLKIISQAISYYLRHKPGELGISLTEDGWTDLGIFIAKFKIKLNEPSISTYTIKQILKNSSKKRFELDIQNNRIRAMYGHSIKDISIDYPELKFAIPLYHGTQQTKVSKILQEGLKSMKRQYVHLTSNIELARETALRYSKKIVIIQVDTERLLQSGEKIFIAGKEIYLVKFVVPEYLHIK